MTREAVSLTRDHIQRFVEKSSAGMQAGEPLPLY